MHPPQRNLQEHWFVKLQHNSCVFTVTAPQIQIENAEQQGVPEEYGVQVPHQQLSVLITERLSGRQGHKQSVLLVQSAG